MKPENLPEKLIWYYILSTYLIFLCGAQYLTASALAIVLFVYLIQQCRNEQKTELPSQKRLKISLSHWIWLIAVLVIEFSLIMGHLDYDLGMTKIIKSTLNWQRTWGIMALFPLAGCLKIRPQIIYRAICILCLQSLLLLPVAYLIGILNLPDLYVSPLKVLGGGDIYYTVNSLAALEEATGQIRLSLFTPWAPALGVIGNIYFLLAQQERERKWRYIGMIGSVAMIISSVSRLAILCLPFVLIVVWLTRNILKPWVQFTASGICFVLGIFSSQVIEFLQDVKQTIEQARADSTRVRSALQRMAIYRWSTEAPLWGHGIIEPKGPRVVAFMPIGSHHTWFGLLYTHGIVGCAAIAVALSWSVIVLVSKAQNSAVGQAALGVMLVLLVFTLGENINSLAYLYWPALIIVGIAFNQPQPVRAKVES
ncbi:MAG: O-antigen ligase domain-containing protein [Cyanobacteria bacterium J083]|nr:MAG: O-antigen ligase domain-containing protein [Cyanobacteria bacterium J083]